MVEVRDEDGCMQENLAILKNEGFPLYFLGYYPKHGEPERLHSYISLLLHELKSKDRELRLKDEILKNKEARVQEALESRDTVSNWLKPT